MTKKNKEGKILIAQRYLYRSLDMGITKIDFKMY